MTDWHPSDTDIARCRDLVARIHTAATEKNAYSEQRMWTAPDGTPVHGTAIDPGTVTADFLRDLRSHTFVFTGWRMTGGQQFPEGIAGAICRGAAATQPLRDKKYPIILEIGGGYRVVEGRYFKGTPRIWST
jgi:hypothetical protein